MKLVFLWEARMSNDNLSKLLRIYECIPCVFLIVFASIVLSMQTASADETTEALSIACDKGDLEAVKHLIESGSDINTKDEFGDSIIGNAASKGHLELVRYLLDKGAKVDLFGMNEQTPIMIACNEGYFEIVKLLVEHDAEINFKNIRGENALGLACRNGNVEIVKFLLNRGADLKSRDIRGCTPFVEACAHGNIQAAKLLLEHDDSIRSQKDVIAEALYASGGCKNFEEVLDFLIDLGADINGTNGNRLGWNTLIEMSVNDRREKIQLLIKKGAMVDFTDSKGNTPLLLAAKGGKMEVVKILLDNGADIKHKNKKGETALTLAKDDDIVDFLNEYGEKPAIPLTLASFDLLHSLPYDKRLEFGLKLAFEAYYRLLTNQPEQQFSVQTTSSKLDVENYKLIYKIDISGEVEEYEIILSNRADKISENFQNLKNTIRNFSEQHQNERREFKGSRSGYNAFRDEQMELLSHFDYSDMFHGLQQVEQSLMSGNLGPEVLFSASEIYSWLAFFKNRNENRKLSDMLATKSTCYFLLGSLGDFAKEHESFCEALLLLSLDYPDAAERSFTDISELEKMLKAYIRQDFVVLKKFSQSPSSNKRLLTYLTARSYVRSDQDNVAWKYFESLVVNYPDFLITKEYIIDKWSIGYSRQSIATYLEDLIENHLTILEKFSDMSWIDYNGDLDRLVKKEVSENRKLEKWLKIHKILVEGTKKLKGQTCILDRDFLESFLMADMENALYIYYRIEAERLGRVTEATAIADIVDSIYPDSSLKKVIQIKEKVNLRDLVKILQKEEIDRFVILMAIKNNLFNISVRFGLMKIYCSVENPDALGLINLFFVNQWFSNRPMAIHCLEEGVKADPYNFLIYQKLFEYKEGSEYVVQGEKRIGNLYGFLISSGDYYFRTGEISKSISCYQKAIQESPDQQTAYERLGELFKKNKEYDKAIQTFQGYLKYDDNTLSAVEIKNKMGKTFIEMGELTKAYDIYMESKTSWQAAALLGFAEISEKTGKIMQAEEYFKKAADRYPTGSCPNLLGLFYLRQGNNDMAVQTFKNYKRYQQQYLNYLYFLADHFTSKESMEKIFEIYTKVEGKTSGEESLSRYKYELARVYADKKLYDHAAAVIEPLALKGNNYENVSLYLIFCKNSKKGDPDKILSTFLEKNASKPKMIWYLTTSCLQSGMFDEALKLIIGQLNRPTTNNREKLSEDQLRKQLISAVLCWRITNGGPEAKEVIRSSLAHRFNDSWSVSCVSFLLGDMDEETILQKALFKKQRAEVFLYSGIMRNSSGNKMEALKNILLYLEVMDEKSIFYHYAYNLAKELAI